MRINISIQKLFSHLDKEDLWKKENSNVPSIDTNRIKELTLQKIQQEKKKTILFRNKFTNVACVLIIAIFIMSGTVYALQSEKFQNVISEMIGINQTEVLKIGESISNKHYKMVVHEIVTDSHVGYVTISVQALSNKAKMNFDNYRISLKHIGSGYGLGELEEYREENIKYYGISFANAKHKYSRSTNLQFGIEGIRKTIEVPLINTVDLKEINLQSGNLDGYAYQFEKLYLSEVGITAEGSNTRANSPVCNYSFEVVFKDGKKEVLIKEINEEQDDILESELVGGVGMYQAGDRDDYVSISARFVNQIPLDSIQSIIINGQIYDIE